MLLFVCAVIACAPLAGRHAGSLFEDAGEVVAVGQAAFCRRQHDGQGSVFQVALGDLDADVPHVMREGKVVVFGKNMIGIGIADAELCADSFQAKARIPAKIGQAACGSVKRLSAMRC